MPEEKEAQVTEAVASAAPSGDKSKSVVVLLLVLSVLVMVLTPVITVLAVKLLSQKQEKAVPSQSEKLEVNLGRTEVNVFGTNGTRIVQADIAAELSNKKLEDYFFDQSAEHDKGKLRLIKNRLIMLVSGKTLDGLLSPEAKDKLAREIKDDLNKLLREYGAEGSINNIYFTKFLIQ